MVILHVQKFCISSFWSTRPTHSHGSVGILVFEHVRTSVSLYFTKTSKNNIHYWRDYGLAEWIIDDTCLVIHFLARGWDGG